MPSAIGLLKQSLHFAAAIAKGMVLFYKTSNQTRLDQTRETLLQTYNH